MKHPFSLKASSVTLSIGLAAYFCIALNFVLANKLYHIIAAMDRPNWLFIVTIPVFFVSAFTLLFSLLTWRPLTKPVFIPLLIISSIVNYTAYYFGIIFNKDMMVNVFETTPAEAASYLNVKLVFWIVLTGVIPAILLFFTEIKYQKFLSELIKKVATIAICIAVIVLIAAFYYKDYASVARNNPKLQKDIVPTYYLSSTVKYIKQRFFSAPIPYTALGTDAKRIADNDKEKYLTVFLVGETARSQNYQLNGYARETNAYTAKISHLVSFKHVTSCGTATAVSLPCMFSLLGKDHYDLDRAESQDNVIDILKRANIQSIWIDNNTGCKGVCKNITAYSTTAMPELHCKGEECTDKVFLDVMDKTIQSFKGQDGVLFLHLLGSHGPTYYKRYPKNMARFQPDCQTSDIQKCTQEEIINSYDNTILFTDYLMAQVIEKMKKYDRTYHTAVVYVSDHGESLGENGLYLHGMPYQMAPEQQTHVPFIIWMSDRMAKHKKLDMACLKREASTRTFSHDNLSHTFLHFMDVKTDIYQKDKDVLYSCEK